MNKPDNHPPQGEHAVAEIADYLDRRLSLERETEIERHLDVCAQCAADFDYAQGLVDAALRSGETHIRPVRQVEITENPQAEFTLAEWDHFQLCRVCQEEAAGLQHLPPMRDLQDSSPTPARTAGGRAATSASTPSRSRPAARSRSVVGADDPSPSIPKATEPEWPAEAESQVEPVSSLAARLADWFLPRGLFWVSGAAAAVLLVMFFLPEATDTVSLAQVSPISVTVPRSAPETGSFGERWARGLEAYVAGNYEAAEVAFAMAREIDANHVEAALLQGSCQLLKGDFEDAIVSLEMALQLSETAEQRDEASWQLANALLLAGNEVRARSLLAEISAQDGSHQVGAAEILKGLAQ